MRTVDLPSPERTQPFPITVEEIRAITPEIINLLNRVTWGTEGARYTLTEIEPTLQHLPNPVFLTLKRKQRLLGLRLFLEKQAQCGNHSLQAFYHSFFAIDPSEKGQGYGKQLARSTVKLLHEKLGTKGLIYCHIEKDNLRSLNIAESLGYQRVGQFSAMTFSRFYPRTSHHLSKLGPGQEAMVCKLLNEQYAGHALTDFSTSLRTDSYYILEEQGQFLAGAQVEPQRWEIHSLAGAGGSVAMHALPHIPLLRDLFNPRDFRFLKIGNVAFRKGRPEAAMELMEAILAHHSLKTAMLFWDKTCPVYQQIAAAGRFGLLNALTETPVYIMALFHGFKASEITDFQQRPKVISPLDI